MNNFRSSETTFIEVTVPPSASAVSRETAKKPPRTNGSVLAFKSLKEVIQIIHEGIFVINVNSIGGDVLKMGIFCLLSRITFLGCIKDISRRCLDDAVLSFA